MKPLVVLFIVFIVALLVTKLAGAVDVRLAGCIGLAAMLLFTALGHFMFTKGMMMMLPSFFPFKKELVLGTGVIEILAAIGLIIPSCKVFTGWFLIAFFILLLPANIYAAWMQVDYQKATYNGKGLHYLWFRIPMQLLLIIWAYYCAIS